MRAASAVLVAAAIAAWACWLVAAPAVAAAPPSRPIAWAAALTYRAGALICHQQAARSLHVGGVRMPVCARCFGLYAGGAAGALLAAAWLFAPGRSSGRPRRLSLARWRAILVASGMPTLAAWAAEHLGGLTVPGAARAALAIPLGAAVAAVVILWAGGTAFDDTARASALHS
jgi:hypothetical protein